MNLRDKRPSNYYKELCQQMPFGRDVQKNDLICSDITQKKSGNICDTNKQEKNNHKTAQILVKLIRSINQQFSKLSSDNQNKVKEENKSFDLQEFALNGNKVMWIQKKHNKKSNDKDNQIQEQLSQNQKNLSRQALKLQGRTSVEQIRRKESQNRLFNVQFFNFLKEINTVAAPLSLQKAKKQQKKTNKKASPKMKIWRQQTQNDLKTQKSNLGKEYSQQGYNSLTNTFIFQEKRKKYMIKSTKINEVNKNADVLKIFLEKKGSIGSQKNSTFFQLKRSSFHIAIAYRIYLLQRKKLGFNFQKFQQLDPTRHSRILKKQRGIDALIAEEKSKFTDKQ